MTIFNQMCHILSKGILAFWATWYSFVTASDLMNILIYEKFIHTNYIFNSKNYQLMMDSFNTYGIPSEGFTMLCFTIIIIWSLAAAVTFWITAFRSRGVTTLVLFAFVLSLSQDALFVISDELFLEYTVEDGHMKRLAVKAISLVLYVQISNLIIKNHKK